MFNNINEVAGYLSGLAISISFFPYIRDILLRKTKPERVSWLIWTILGGISFSSQLFEGASYSLILPGIQAFGDLLIFLLAIKFGLGGFTRRDIVALIGAGISLILWYITQEAAVALFIVIFIDAIGVVLTILKAYENPETETVSTWALTSLAGFFGCLAVGTFDFVLLVFPVYIFLGCLAIIVSIKMGFRKQARIDLVN